MLTCLLQRAVPFIVGACTSEYTIIVIAMSYSTISLCLMYCP